VSDHEPLDPAADQPDPVVVGALRDLPVPEHRLTFWADLDAALRDAAEELGAAATAPPATTPTDGAGSGGSSGPTTSEVPVLRHAPPRPSFARRAAPWLAAVAGLVVVGAAAGFVLSSGDDDDGDFAATTTSEAATESDSTSQPVPDTTVAPATTTVTTVAVDDDPAEVARTFIDALGSGDTELALSMLGPRSVAYIESLGGDPLGFVTEMQEGYGSWAGAPDLDVSSTSAGVVAPLESELAIVTVQGTNPGEGDAEDRVDAFPMVREGDQWVVELVAFADGRDNRLRFTLPESDGSGRLGTMPPDGEINVFVPTPGTVLYQIDGGEVRDDQTADIPAGTFSLHAPPDPLAPGEHVLVAVAVGSDGTLVPFGSKFTVEG
jgi:hypothetical protein